MEFTFDYYQDFVKKLDPLNDHFVIRPRGIWTSELFALYCFAEEFKIEHYIESGLGNGQSFINMMFLLDPAVYKTGIDIEEKEWVDKNNIFTFNGMIQYGRGEEIIIRRIETTKSKVTGIFLDGPKGTDAYELAIDLMLYSNVDFVAMHDTPKGSAVRERIEQCEKWNHWSSDDKYFVDQYGHLDNNRWSEHLPEDKASGHLPYLNVRTGKQCESYGPTLTVIYKD